MAKEKKQDGHHSWKWNDLITTVLPFPVAGLVIREVSEVLLEKGVKKIQKKAEEVLGTLDEAEKDLTDEILFDLAIYSMKKNEWMEIDSFVERLRQENPRKTAAFVLYVAKKMQFFQKDVTETTTPKKGEKGPKISQQYKNLKDGLIEARKFLRIFLAVKGDNDEETFLKRVSFLEGKNAFSSIPKEAHPFV